MGKRVVLTGDRPTGPLHLGHYVGSLESRIALQEECEQYIMIADMQALTDCSDRPQMVRDAVLQVALDYLAVGIDPDKSAIFVQSLIPPLSELTLYYLNLVSWNRLKHNPTVKREIGEKGFGGSVPAGFMVYPVSQAADITAFKASVVPVGEDQRPMIEQTNEIVRAFNRTYGCDLLVEVEALVSPIARLPGLDGRSKMSKSLNNAIYLSDSLDDVVQKVRGMYTDPGHVRVEDPGRVEGNPVFTYLDAFGTELEEIRELKERYRRGGLGDRVVKDYLTDVMLAFLEPIQRRRREWEGRRDEVWRVLQKGGEKALATASHTLREVRSCMHLDYGI